MTVTLIAINFIAFVVMNVSVVAQYAPGGVSPLDPPALIRWGASYGPLELSTQWWRVFTAMFVHIGLLHIAFNMYSLWSLGSLAEPLFGSGKFLLLYVLSGLGGNVASVALHPTIVAAGASGAIFGVAGALLPVLQMRDIPAIVSLRGRGGLRGLGIGGFIVYNLIYGFANTGIDNAAHMGGLVVGFIIGYAVPVAGSHTGRVAMVRTQGVLLATALFLGAAFVGARHWRHTYAELEAGRRAILNGDDARGIAQLHRVLQSDPDNPQAHLLMGAVYYDQDSMRAAVREFQLALRGDTTEQRPRQPLDRAFVLLNLGAAYERLGQWDSAAAAYTGATRANPSDAEAWEGLGEAYLRNHRAADAVGSLERAAKLAPDTARIYFKLGLAYDETRRYSAALASFQRGLRLTPDDPVGLIQRGVVYAQLGKFDSARADFRTVLNKPDGTIDAEIRAEARRLLAALPGGGGLH